VYGAVPPLLLAVSVRLVFTQAVGDEEETLSVKARGCVIVKTEFILQAVRLSVTVSDHCPALSVAIELEADDKEEEV
jgi:hypothetical protein